jgi:hypothetical protein
MAAKRRKRKAKSKRSRKADRARVSSKAHEVAYLARKHKVSAADVRAVIKKVGNSRKKVEAALAKM